jgi:AraC-like DNA-binding protein
MTDGVYREARPTADLAGHIRRVWYRRIGQEEASRPIRVVPDGCIDLMWMRGELLVAGPDTTAWVGRIPAGTEIVGLRFRPGTAPSVLGVPATEIVDDRLSAADVAKRWTGDFTGRLEAAQSLTAASALLQEAVRLQLAEAPALDPVVQHVVSSVQGYQSVRVDRLADHLGLSERQLHRRCCAALGYGPKTFGRIVRFQRFLASARESSAQSFARLAADTGYADQSHLTREVRRLAGLAPAELVAKFGRGP